MLRIAKHNHHFHALAATLMLATVVLFSPFLVFYSNTLQGSSWLGWTGLGGATNNQPAIAVVP